MISQTATFCMPLEAFSYFVDVDEVRTTDATLLCRADVPWCRDL